MTASSVTLSGLFGPSSNSSKVIHFVIQNRVFGLWVEPVVLEQRYNNTNDHWRHCYSAKTGGPSRFFFIEMKQDFGGGRDGFFLVMKQVFGGR